MRVLRVLGDLRAASRGKLPALLAVVRCELSAGVYGRFRSALVR